MKMSFDNQQLITIGEDSSVLVWKIQDKEGRAGIRKEAEVSYAEEILITKSDLEDKVSYLLISILTSCLTQFCRKFLW